MWLLSTRRPRIESLEGEPDGDQELGVATAREREEDCAWGEPEELLSRLIDVRRLGKRPRVAFPRNPSCMDRDTRRRHGPHLRFWYRIEVRRQNAESPVRADTVRLPSRAFGVELLRPEEGCCKDAETSLVKCVCFIPPPYARIAEIR